MKYLALLALLLFAACTEEAPEQRCKFPAHTETTPLHQSYRWEFKGDAYEEWCGDAMLSSTGTTVEEVSEVCPGEGWLYGTTWVCDGWLITDATGEYDVCDCTKPQ